MGDLVGSLLESVQVKITHAKNSCVGVTSVDQVRDLHGDGVFPGMTYYVNPGVFQLPRGGGLRLASVGNSKCPVTVLQDFSEKVIGEPLQFLLHGITPGIIFTGTPVTAKFSEMTRKKPACVSSTELVVFVDKTINKTCVGIGGPQDHPGQETYEGRFHFEQDGLGFRYNLVFCYLASSTNCSSIARYDNGEGGFRLVLDNQIKPFQLGLLYAKQRP
ncbi:hypothetical protein Fmac_015688 [Flemingia macrophylla]|uniref:Uncharacterized protein n=1 Tax=Flemingia macrophylla TaxID=520843 RepID=A0ABD1MHC8_9FABA